MGKVGSIDHLFVLYEAASLFWYLATFDFRVV